MQVEKKAFQKELEFVLRFVEKKSTIPVLQNISMVAAHGTLTMIGTDLEVAGMTTVPGHMADDETAWATTVPGHIVMKYLKQVEDEEFDIRPIIKVIPPTTTKLTKYDNATKKDVETEVPVEGREDHTIKISHGEDSTATFDGIEPKCFPEVPLPNVMHGQLRGLKSLYQRAEVAISKEASRFTLSGALLELWDDKPSVMVSTDGHRLSYQNVHATVLTPCKALIPKKALYEASRINGDSCYFGRDENFMLFMSGSRAVIARVLTGTFPDYNRAMPSEMWRSMSLDTEAFKKLCKRVALCADERSRCVQVYVEGQKLAVEAKQFDKSARGTVDTEWPDDAPFRVGLNVEYVLEFLNLAPGLIEFQVPAISENKDSADKAVFFATPDQSWKYLVMPMRI